MDSAPIAVSATIKSLDQYAVESGIPRTTLWDWIRSQGFPATKVGHNWLVSPVHVLQWFESRAAADLEAAKQAEARIGTSEAGPKSGQLRRDPSPPVGPRQMEGTGLGPPPSRPKRAA